MDKRELEIIQELMEELQDQMSEGSDDFDERLGRKKPEVKVMKIEGEIPHSMDDKMERDEERLGMDLDGDHEEGEPMEHQRKVLGGIGQDDEDMEHDPDMDDAAFEDSRMGEEMMSPDEKLKLRIKKLRG